MRIVASLLFSLLLISRGFATQDDVQEAFYASVKTSGGLAGITEFSCVTGGDFYSSRDRQTGSMSKEEREELIKLARALIDSKPERMYGSNGPDKIVKSFQITLGSGDSHVDFGVTVYQGAQAVPKELTAYSKKYFELMELTRNLSKIEKERLEIEKLKLDIQVQKKVLENLEKKDQKEPKSDPALPKIIIIAYTGDGIRGKADEAIITDGQLTHRGFGSKGLPVYNIPEEDREELFKLSGALIFSLDLKIVYGERGPDVSFNNYTLSFPGKRERTVTWYKDGSKVPVDLEKFDKKYREIHARSKPVK